MAFELGGVFAVVETVRHLESSTNGITPRAAGRGVVQHCLGGHARHEGAFAADSCCFEDDDLETGSVEFGNERLRSGATPDDRHVDLHEHRLGACLWARWMLVRVVHEHGVPGWTAAETNSNRGLSVHLPG